ncbi:hypothetical protein [Ekhidna sp.]
MKQKKEDIKNGIKRSRKNYKLPMLFTLLSSLAIILTFKVEQVEQEEEFLGI